MANSNRRDPYKNFNFLAAIGAAVGGIAVLGLVRRLFARVERRAPGVYVEEKPAGTRPIEGVGTSTAGFTGQSRKQSPRTSRRAPARTSRRKR